MNEVLGLRSEKTIVRIDHSVDGGRTSDHLLSSLSDSTHVPLHFADVVHETEELPLRRHLASSAMTEAIESMRAADVGEHGLDDPEPLSGAMPPEVAVDLTLHARTVCFGFTFCSADEERHLTLDGALGMSQTLRPLCAAAAVTLVGAEVDRLKPS